MRPSTLATPLSYTSAIYPILHIRYNPSFFFFFFNDTATTEIYTLSLHDALPICTQARRSAPGTSAGAPSPKLWFRASDRSEEHTSELQSRQYLVCRLLLEKKKQQPDRSRLGEVRTEQLY